eukprot:7578021-Alexandrium_andersonii.AAC.1
MHTAGCWGLTTFMHTYTCTRTQARARPLSRKGVAHRSSTLAHVKEAGSSSHRANTRATPHCARR